MRLVIKNCNCIKKAEIEIIEKTLNIKYGQNGTVKTAISEAIFAKAAGNNDRLNDLLPYGADEEKEDEIPTVENLTFSKVRVFDEEYVNSYLLKGDEFFSDSYQVFLKSEKCDNLARQIELLLSELQGIFQESEERQKLRLFLPEYFEAVKYTDGAISKKVVLENL